MGRDENDAQVRAGARFRRHSATGVVVVVEGVKRGERCRVDSECCTSCARSWGSYRKSRRPIARSRFVKRRSTTCVALFVFLVCSQLPLYGINTSSGADPFYWARVIMASNRGTCMELGISPIVTSGLVIQLLSGSKIIEVDESVKEDRALLNGAQKLLGVLITIGEAVAYVVSGIYGDVRDLGVGNAHAHHNPALLRGHHRHLPLDELLQKGYGLGSGISLSSQRTNANPSSGRLSPRPPSTRAAALSLVGAIIAFFHLMLTPAPTRSTR